jgi:hypothetical protein
VLLLQREVETLVVAVDARNPARLLQAAPPIAAQCRNAEARAPGMWPDRVPAVVALPPPASVAAITGGGSGTATGAGTDVGAVGPSVENAVPASDAAAAAAATTAATTAAGSPPESARTTALIAATEAAYNAETAAAAAAEAAALADAAAEAAAERERADDLAAASDLELVSDLTHDARRDDSNSGGSGNSGNGNGSGNGGNRLPFAGFLHTLYARAERVTTAAKQAARVHQQQQQKQQLLQRNQSQSSMGGGIGGASPDNAVLSALAGRAGGPKHAAAATLLPNTSSFLPMAEADDEGDATRPGAVAKALLSLSTRFSAALLSPTGASNGSMDGNATVQQSHAAVATEGNLVEVQPSFGSTLGAMQADFSLGLVAPTPSASAAAVALRSSSMTGGGNGLAIDTAPPALSWQSLEVDLHDTHVPVEALDLDAFEDADEAAYAQHQLNHASTNANSVALAGTSGSGSLGSRASSGAIAGGQPSNASHCAVFDADVDAVAGLVPLGADLCPLRSSRELARPLLEVFGQPVLAALLHANWRQRWQALTHLARALSTLPLDALEARVAAAAANGQSLFDFELESIKDRGADKGGDGAAGGGGTLVAALERSSTSLQPQQLGVDDALIAFRAHVQVLATALQDASHAVFVSALALAAQTVHRFVRVLPTHELLNWVAPLLGIVLDAGGCGHRVRARRRPAMAFVMSLAALDRSLTTSAVATGGGGGSHVGGGGSGGGSSSETSGSGSGSGSVGPRFGARWVAAKLLTGIDETHAGSWRTLLARLSLMQQLVLAFGVDQSSDATLTMGLGMGGGGALAVDALMRWSSLLLQHRSLYVRNGAIALVWTLNAIDARAVEPFLRDLAPLMMPRLEGAGEFTAVGAVGMISEGFANSTLGGGGGGVRIGASDSIAASAARTLRVLRPTALMMSPTANGGPMSSRNAAAPAASTPAAAAAALADSAVAADATAAASSTSPTESASATDPAAADSAAVAAVNASAVPAPALALDVAQAAAAASTAAAAAAPPLDSATRAAAQSALLRSL